MHAALASNFSLAVGGQPKFYRPDIVPKYPGPVPHHRRGFTVNLERASVDYVRDICMYIEFPEEAGAPPEVDNWWCQITDGRCGRRTNPSLPSPN